MPCGSRSSALSGLPNAVRVFEEMRQKGHEPTGIRLDSGDLAYLSVRAAKMLNDAGFPDVKIVLSNELDAMNISGRLLPQIQQEATRNGLDADHLIQRLVYGAGTRLITSAGDSALGGVYKLTALKKKGKWIPVIKACENIGKIPNPGQKNVWRIYNVRGKAVADLLSRADEDPHGDETIVLRHPVDSGKFRNIKTK